MWSRSEKRRQDTVHMCVQECVNNIVNVGCACICVSLHTGATYAGVNWLTTVQL